MRYDEAMAEPARRGDAGRLGVVEKSEASHGHSHQLTALQRGCGTFAVSSLSLSRRGA